MIASSQAVIMPDTNVLVHYVRRSPLYQQIEMAYPLTQRIPIPLVSIVTHGEAYSLAAQFGWGKARYDVLQSLLASCATVGLDFPGLVEAYAELDAYSLRIGRRIGDNDLWIAATAKVTGAILLTTDKDFDHLHPIHVQRIWIDPNTR